MEQKSAVNKLVFHPRFKDVVSEISKLDIKLPPPVSQQDMDFSFLSTSITVKADIEKSLIIKLDAKAGSEIVGLKGISAYDESKNKFMALEGTAYLTSHSLVVLSEKEYLPSNFITFNFYTRSRSLSKDSSFIKYSEDPESDSNKDYHLDRTKFLLETTPKNSILFIDGPLVGAQATAYTLKLNEALLKENIIPLFFVKNSNSNLVINSIEEFKEKYNSDLHWANRNLKKGERTCFFTYTDKENPENTKLFCYIKAYEATAQRIEMHPDTYKKFKEIIPSLMNLVYYLMVVQGSPQNPQIRPIAIAEMYARQTLWVVNFTKTMSQLNITPTMNQNRGFTQ